MPPGRLSRSSVVDCGHPSPLRLPQPPRVQAPPPPSSPPYSAPPSPAPRAPPRASPVSLPLRRRRQPARTTGGFGQVSQPTSRHGSSTRPRAWKRLRSDSDSSRTVGPESTQSSGPGTGTAGQQTQTRPSLLRRSDQQAKPRLSSH